MRDEVYEVLAGKLLWTHFLRKTTLTLYSYFSPQLLSGLIPFESV
jgi:hypothetical protein